MPYRIKRSTEGDIVTFTLSGVLDAQHVAKLQLLVGQELALGVVLDLREVTRADRQGIHFLVAARNRGIELTNVPEYVLTWMAAERDDD